MPGAGFARGPSICKPFRPIKRFGKEVEVVQGQAVELALPAVD